MLIPPIALLAFTFCVSFHMWPQAVLGISSLVGVPVTLQYLLFGAHRIVLGIRWVLKRIGAVFVQLFSRREVEPVEKEKDIDSPRLITDIDGGKIIGDKGKEKGNEKQPS